MKLHSASGRWFAAVVIILVAVCVGVGVVQVRLRAQDDDERRLWDSEFLKKRQTTTGAPTTTPRRSPVYKRTSPATPPDNATTVPETKAIEEVLGITIWRLRQSTPADSQDSRLLIQEDDKTAPAEWTPQRVEADTTFTAGEPIRLSIESPRSGFLYVIDREQYDDRTTSDPYLIFPTLRMRGGDNAVLSGKVIELPERSTFRLKAMRPDYRGELLTVLVSSDALPNIRPSTNAQRLDRALVEGWERQWLGRVERFEMVGGAGRSYTRAEKQAGVEGRLLTRDDDLPQTLYRISTTPGDPLVLSVPLRIAK